jgi:hypothetical protein
MNNLSTTERIKKFVRVHRDSGLSGKVLGLLVDTAKRIYSPKRSKHHKSEHSQDCYVDDHFNEMTGGSYVEVGAHTGVEKSNTYFLHFVRGWRGICIEPNPALYPQLVAIEPLKPVYVFPRL